MFLFSQVGDNMDTWDIPLLTSIEHHNLPLLGMGRLFSGTQAAQTGLHLLFLRYLAADSALQRIETLEKSGRRNAASVP
jgi:hypothetical protein